MLVTAEDFNIRPYKLPNLDNEQVNAEFTQFVEDWEAEWYRRIFGRSFYDKFIEGINALPPEWDAEDAYVAADQTLVVEGLNIYRVIVDNTNSKPTPTNANWEVVELGNRWLKLIKGYTYSILPGRVYTWVGLMSAEKFAIFSAWTKAGVDSVAGVGGTVTADVENSEVASSAQNIATSWNKFARLIGGRTKQDKYDTLFGYLISTSQAGTFDDTFDESFNSFIQYMASEFGWPGRLNQFNF
jgi:hypothetical protein